jgi:hypothetical protein
MVMEKNKSLSPVEVTGKDVVTFDFNVEFKYIVNYEQSYQLYFLVSLIQEQEITLERYLHGENAKCDCISSRRASVSTRTLTPWCRTLFEKLIVTQLSKNIPLSYGTQKFITVFTKARHWTLS